MTQPIYQYLYTASHRHCLNVFSTVQDVSPWMSRSEPELCAWLAEICRSALALVSKNISKRPEPKLRAPLEGRVALGSLRVRHSCLGRSTAEPFADNQEPDALVRLGLQEPCGVNSLLVPAPQPGQHQDGFI